MKIVRVEKMGSLMAAAGCASKGPEQEVPWSLGERWQMSALVLRALLQVSEVTTT